MFDEGDSGAGGVVGELVFAEFADGEIFGVGVVKVEAAHGAGGIHGAGFGESDADFFFDGD